MICLLGLSVKVQPTFSAEEVQRSAAPSELSLMFLESLIAREQEPAGLAKELASNRHDAQ
jgi:hypothetical protein